MTGLSEQQIVSLLEPFLQSPLREPDGVSSTSPQDLLAKLKIYLDLLVRWNARTNLTAVRDPATIVTRHFGESLFAGRILALLVRNGDRVLDFGSGAGLPGVPIQLMLPEVRVTLAESQRKKAAFLREVVRELALPSEVWAGRVEDLPQEVRFDAVLMRAVDRMESMQEEAWLRVGLGGVRLTLVGLQTLERRLGAEAYPVPMPGRGAVVVEHSSER